MCLLIAAQIGLDTSPRQSTRALARCSLPIWEAVILSRMRPFVVVEASRVHVRICHEAAVRRGLLVASVDLDMYVCLVFVRVRSRRV